MLERIEKIPVPLVPNIGFCCVTHKAWYIITLLNATKSRSSISVNVQHSGSVTLLKSCTMKNLFSTAKKKKKRKEERIQKKKTYLWIFCLIFRVSLVRVLIFDYHMFIRLSI